MTTMRRIVMTLALVTGCDPEKIPHQGDDGSGDAEATFPTRYAEAYCTALFACDPTNTCDPSPDQPYATEAECVEGERTLLEEVAMVANNAEMTFDPDCVDRLIAQFDEVGCDSFTRLQVRFGESYHAIECQPYFGDVPVDEDPCFEIPGSELSTCAANAHCSDEQCIAVEPNGCGCPDGQTCKYGGIDDSCQPVLDVGEQCISPDLMMLGVCAVDSYCSWNVDDDGMLIGPQACVAAAPLGASCLSPFDCASHACEDEVCVVASPWLCNDRIAPRRWR